MELSKILRRLSPAETMALCQTFSRQCPRQLGRTFATTWRLPTHTNAAGDLSEANHALCGAASVAKAKALLLSAALMLCALELGCDNPARSAGQASSTGQTSARPATAAGASLQIPEAREVGQAFASVAERLAPSVVRVTTKQQRPTPLNVPGPELNPFDGTPFEHFFEDFGRTHPEPPGARVGMGSGVMIDAQGHILTNHHVVAHAEEVRVTFMDGKEVKAKVVGTDPKTDLAVLEVDGATAMPAEFGDSAAMRVGEWVIAIGNPFGLDHSVTVGVLSAKGRYGFAPGKLEDFLQTDASINPGMKWTPSFGPKWGRAKV
jgi:serine protease Do